MPELLKAPHGLRIAVHGVPLRKLAFRWLHLVQEIPRDKYTASPNLPWLDYLIRMGDEPETLHRISCSRQLLT